MDFLMMAVLNATPTTQPAPQNCIGSGIEACGVTAGLTLLLRDGSEAEGKSKGGCPNHVIRPVDQ